MKSTMKITVPSLLVRKDWTSLEDTGWDAATLFEIVMRYCDAQDHAKSYRTRAALKVKLLKARMEKIDELAAASNMTVEEYLELESTNLGA